MGWNSAWSIGQEPEKAFSVRKTQKVQIYASRVRGPKGAQKGPKYAPASCQRSVGNHNLFELTSLPTTRDARRRGTNLHFRPLKSLPHKSMNICSMCNCSTAIFPPGNHSATRN